MMYKTKSVLIARKKRVREEDYNHRPCFISLFDENDPHLNVQGPKKVIELNVHYLLPGNDIVINNLTQVSIEEHGDKVTISGHQE